jgi:thiosulfate/3-mercaptopyruvate sulfurtransferase
MQSTKKFKLILVFLFTALQFLSAKGDKNDFIVSTSWLAKHLKDPDIVLIEIGQKADYDREHIPGAVFMTRDEISTTTGSGLTLQIPSIEKLIESFENAGVSNNSRIILYYGNDWVTPTARFYLTLDYMGFGENTSILDGGLPEWKKENLPLTSEKSKVKKGRITITLLNKDAVVDVNYVEKNLNNPEVQIVDARTEDFYAGSDTSYDRPGHITGATNIPFTSLTTVNPPYLFKSKNELEQIYSNANVSNYKTVVSYCHIGQQASLVYFIARYLGYKAKLYDGSYQEWDKRTDLPVIGAVKRKN